MERHNLFTWFLTYLKAILQMYTVENVLLGICQLLLLFKQNMPT